MAAEPRAATICGSPEGKTIMQSKPSELLGKAELIALIESADHLNASLSLDEVLQSLLETACRLLDSTAASIILHDTKHEELYFAAATGPVPLEKLKKNRIPPGKGVAGEVFLSGEPAIKNELAAEPAHYRQVDEATDFKTKTMMCVPLASEERTIGVMQVLNKADGTQPYAFRDLILLKHLAKQATIAIWNSNLMEKLMASGGLYAAREVRNDLVSGMWFQGIPLQRELISVLFANMRGYNKLFAETDPEDIQRMLEEFRSMLCRSTLMAKGIVNKFMGDGLMAIFRGEECSRNAVRAAFEMRQGFAELLPGWISYTASPLEDFLGVGVGITTGNVLLGSLGSGDVYDFTAIGTSVNLARALEKSARGQRCIRCDRVTFQRAKPLLGDYESESFAVPERGLDLPVYNLKALASSENRVFVSFSTKDQDWVQAQLIEPLRDRKVNTFFAPHTIAAGAPWSDVIGSEIVSSTWFLVVVTEESVKSRWVRDEVSFALDQEHLDARIVSILVDETDPSQLSWRLRNRQHLTASNDTSQAVVEQLVKLLG